MSNFRNAEDIVKVFGMTNQLLEIEMDRIEQLLGIDLGRKTGSAENIEEIYYPQFESYIRTEAKIMAKHYEIFYCLEKTIRSLINEQLIAVGKLKWWDTGRVPPEVFKNTNARMQREVDSGFTIRSTDPLDYTTFGELGEIIKANWDVFGAIFNSQKAVEKVMANLNMLRGPIAHCSPLAEDEVLRLQLSLRDWFRLME